MRRKPPEECVSAGSCLYSLRVCRNRRGARVGRAGWNGRLYNKTITALPRKVARLAAWRRRPGRGGGDKDPRGKKNGRRAALFGGEDGIRTLERLNTFTRFPGVRLQPLIHLSVGEARIIVGLARKKQGAARSGALTFPFGPERLKTGESRKRGGAPAEAKSPLGARRLGRRAASPPPPHLIPPRARHALATRSPRARRAHAASLSFSLSRSPTRLSRPLLGKAAARPMICRPIIAK